MVIRSAEFLKSSPTAAQCPPESLPEFAFIGRSNVGKSSLINRMVNRKDLAKTSSTPGKTKTINHFLINKEWYLVDLPGYGYAKVSKKEREEFQKMIRGFLTRRSTLSCVFVLVDVRVKPQESDLGMIRFLGEKGIPLVVVFTKIDKLTLAEKSANVKDFKKALLEDWEELPPIIETSSVSGRGIEDVLNVVEGAM